MNLSSLLQQRAAAGRPVRVGLIGAGKFGSMVLAQARRIKGLQVVGAPTSIPARRGRRSPGSAGRPSAIRRGPWATPSPPARPASPATSPTSPHARRSSASSRPPATRSPASATRLPPSMPASTSSWSMADVLCGPLLAERARAKGLVYSMAYGDQPAIICELVDWVHSCGFELTSAGKGMNFEPRYRYSTPDTVWSFFGWSDEQVAKGDFNPKMYNSFTDGTKAAIEMAAVANGTGLDCPDEGLAFPPAGLQDLARVFRPAADGGRLSRSGLVDIAASQEPDGREVFNNIRFGVFVTFRANNEYTRACFEQYGMLTDPSGWYGSMWRPFHLIGLETSVSVLSAVLRGEPTGTPKEFRGDAVATAKRELKPGEMLDGEGGFTVWANAIPAAKSLAIGGLPIGLAHNVKLKRPVAKDSIVRVDDVELVNDLDVVALRRQMEAGTRTDLAKAS